MIKIAREQWGEVSRCFPSIWRSCICVLFSLCAFMHIDRACTRDGAHSLADAALCQVHRAGAPASADEARRRGAQERAERGGVEEQELGMMEEMGQGQARPAENSANETQRGTRGPRPSGPDASGTEIRPSSPKSPTARPIPPIQNRLQPNFPSPLEDSRRAPWAGDAKCAQEPRKSHAPLPLPDLSANGTRV